MPEFDWDRIEQSMAARRQAEGTFELLSTDGNTTLTMRTLEEHLDHAGTIYAMADGTVRWQLPE